MAENSKTKVLFVITKGNFGGAQRYVYDLATGLPKTKFDTVVACGDQDGDTLKNMLVAAGIRTLTLEGSGREIKAKGDFSVLKQIILFIKEEKPDVVHLNSSKISLLGALAVFWLRLEKLVGRYKDAVPRLVFTSHGWAFNEKNRSPIWKFVFWLSYYVTIIGSNHTIAVSEKTKKDISFLPFIKNRIQVIHNGLDEFELLPKEEARSILAGTEKRLILSIGELHPSKGYDVALKALTKLPDEIRNGVDYRIIGGGEEKEKLEQMIQELKLEDTVKLLGPIENAKKLLLGADILLFPSRNENLPYTILEAGFASLPIIATNVGGVPEIITDMKDGILVHKENSKEIREAIIYMVHNPERMKEFSIEIKKNITKNFSRNKMIKETARVLQ